MTPLERSDRFRCFGFAHVEGYLGPAEVAGLQREVGATLTEAFPRLDSMIAGAAGNLFRYVPTMTERTPRALEMVKQLANLAEELLAGPVLPSRAKATVYRGPTRWHRDSATPLPSVGCLLYLEPLTAAGGALEVLPGSHWASFAEAVEQLVVAGHDLPGRVLETSPGDLIAFDERLYHASTRAPAACLRRQWRVDFVPDRPELDDALRAYFAGQYSPTWDAGYDVDTHPSYGPAWRALDARWDRRLTELGAYAAASAEEDASRKRRASLPPARG
jgi:hypothetical protein